LATATAVVVSLAACGTTSPGTSSGPRAGGALHGTIIISAASSLSTVFASLATRFEAGHPAVQLTFNFGSSSSLGDQIVQGAPADVFATADGTSMNAVAKAGDLTGRAVPFAGNTLALVVKPGNPNRITSLASLREARTVALCVASAPCGRAAAKVLRHAHVTLPVSMVTRGLDAEATLAEVTISDADAAIVFVTDALTVGHLGEMIAIPKGQNAVTTYEIAVVKGTVDAQLARAWVAFVTGPTGQRLLKRAGFFRAP
jgi:molybdate transport system substrate-binding protein